MVDNWTKKAKCAKLGHLFYPSKETHKLYLEKARQLCATCTVQPECQEYAKKNNEQYGIWAGIDLEEKDRIRRRKHHN